MADRMSVSRKSFRYPRVKPEHRPYRVAGGKIRIGGVSYGVAGEIEDPGGWIWILLGAMDGSRTAGQIIGAVRTARPRLPEQIVRRGIEQLIASGYVEDAGAVTPDVLTERDLIRYDRSMRFLRWLDTTPRASSWEPQAMLRVARVTVIGMGGTGGAAAMALAASGVGRLHCVDHDLVELSNLCRQVLYSESDIGQPKADVAAARLRQVNSDIEITSSRMRVAGRDDAAELAGDCDVLLLSADTPPGLRIWVNRACLATCRPWVDAGYHGPRTQVGTYVPTKGACWECTRAHSAERHAAVGAYPGESKPQADATWNAVNAASAGISGFLAAHQVMALITGIPPAAPGRIDAINLSATDTPASIFDPPHPECPACGERPRVVSH